MGGTKDWQIHALIEDEAAALLDFIGVLEQEQQALASGKLENLLFLAEQKSHLAQELSALDDRRLALLAATPGSKNSEDIMTAWLDANLLSRKAWQSVLEHTARARDINNTNGKLISERMRHNQQALAVLMAAGEAAALYGPDGQPRLGSGGRTLGSA